MSTLDQSTLNNEKVRNLLKGPDNVAAATVTVPTTTGSMPVYDKDGVILGYVALFANASLT